jgi:hypothetical protein
MTPNPNATGQDAQLNNQLDHLLLTHLGPAPTAADHLIPSSGFTHSVMEAIHQQTTAPPPIPFPWKRLVPSAIALACTLLAFAWLATSQSTTTLTQSLSLNLSPSTIMTITLIASAIAISIVTTAISFKLSTRRP